MNKKAEKVAKRATKKIMSYEDIPLEDKYTHKTVPPYKVKVPTVKPKKKAQEPDNLAAILQFLCLNKVALIVAAFTSGWLAHSPDDRKFEALLTIVIGVLLQKLIDKGFIKYVTN